MVTTMRRASVLPRFDDQGGFTLVEMVVAMAVLSIALVILLSTLTTVQKAVVNEDLRSQNVDQARLAMQSIDRQLRSGNLLYNPSSETPAGFTLRVYTQAYALQDNASYIGGSSRCALWTVDDNEQLLYRYWPQGRPSEATGWQVIASGIINREVSPQVGAFTLDPTGRTVTVRFLVNTQPGTAANATQDLQSAVTGRNTSFGFPADVCADLPT
jgi:prepilin-type N-terminal cleavage/methylation domain-containing protein